MSFNAILLEQNTKEVAWTYKSILNDCLPNHLKDLAPDMDSPDTILSHINELQKKLDSLNNTPLEEQIQSYITSYNEWKEDAETRLTDEHKLLRDKCNTTLAELYRWEPLSESSIYFKRSLINLIKNYLSQSLYARELFIHPETPDAESAKYKIESHKKELTDWIEKLKIKYPISLEIQRERDLLESQLLQDLELLG
jgi:hypothetical protein